MHPVDHIALQFSVALQGASLDVAMDFVFAMQINEALQNFTDDGLDAWSIVE